MTKKAGAETSVFLENFQKPTEELEEILKQMRPSQLDGYFKNNAQRFTGFQTFYNYFTEVLDKKGFKLNEVYGLAGLTESYGGKIVRMERHTVERDKILRLCVAGHFTLEETNRSLKLYGMNELYAKDRRDSVLIVALNNRIYNFRKIDEMLIQHGFPKLSKQESE